MNTSTTHAVILAAGAGSRLGGISKGRLTLGGEPLILRAVQRCLDAGISGIRVVIGAQAEQVRPLIPQGPFIRTIENLSWENGRTSSLQTGLRELEQGGLVLIFPVDVALIGPEVIPALLIAAARHPDATRTRWTPVWEFWRGHPILITSDLIPELLALPSDADPKPVFRSATDIPVPVNDPMVAQGIKTPEDVLRGGLEMPKG